MRADHIPRGLIDLVGSCPCPCLWAWAHGAHLLCRFPGIGIPRPLWPRAFLKRPMDISAAKAALRKDALARRGLITETEARAFGERLAAIGAGLAAEKKAAIASAFWSIDSEPRTAPLLKNLARSGIATALPVMQGKGQPLLFRLWREGEPLNEVKWGIKEPRAAAQEVLPDLLFVPLAAYDKAGNRLGYGAGFYDRTLHKLRALKPVTAVGVAYDIQEMPLVPTDATDEPLDFILTNRAVIACKPA